MTEPGLSHAEPREPVVGDVLGPRGAAVMRVLWNRGSATVGAVVDALNAERRRPLAYTTVINVGGLIGAILASVFDYRFRRRILLPYGALVAVLVAHA